MKGYQFLENDFFELCQTREIGHTPMLLYIYLRGLFCRFQKPIFTWQDKQTIKHLGISQSTLLRAREYLQTRGMITVKAAGIPNIPCSAPCFYLSSKRRYGIIAPNIQG